MRNILSILNRNIVNRILFVVSSLLLTGAYYLALTQSVSFQSFTSSNSPLFVFLQISLSLLNALLGATAITLIVDLFVKQKQFGKTNIFQSIASLFVSIATTGCYVCGSILLPSLGIASAFASMPFGGLEIKVLTLFLMIYSLIDLNKKSQGICKVYNDKYLAIRAGNKLFKINIKPIYQYQSLLVTIVVISLMFALPQVLPGKTTLTINDASQYSCTSDHAL